ncbi:hypothetical protein [Amycolatopsis sp. GA6-003]|uniref:hypothetical protein n=1 Tax=Amycolatopsis sp. GA6-003 TaxID=2652444 RepID=UPI00391716A3
MSAHGTLHHVELWVPDLGRAVASLGWLLEELGYQRFQDWDAATVEQMAADAARHGWQLMFPEKHPYAGGAEHYAAYLQNDDGFEVELVSSAAQ